jgi:hypothetical protein
MRQSDFILSEIETRLVIIRTCETSAGGNLQVLANQQEIIRKAEIPGAAGMTFFQIDLQEIQGGGGRWR